MPRFYCTTEEEAMKYIREHMPPPTQEAARLTEAQLDAVIARLGADVPPSRREFMSMAYNQPLFRRSPNSASTESGQSAEKGFSISHDTVFDYQKEALKKRAPKQQIDVSSPRSPDTPEGKVWRQRPGSGMSTEMSSSELNWEDGVDLDSSSVVAEAGDNTNTGQPSTSIETSNDKNPSDLKGLNDILKSIDDDPEVALAGMDTAFSKWTHARREGIDAVNDIVIGAPSNLHAIMADRDRKIWSKETNPNSPFVSTEDSRSQEHGHLLDLVSTFSHDEDALVGYSPTSEHPTRKNKGKAPLDRAQIIAKGKAANESSIFNTQSATQKLSARYKNKNRKSIMAPPPPPSKTKQPDHDLETKSESQDEMQKCKVIFINKTDSDCRLLFDKVLRSGTVDPTKDSDVDALFEVMSTFGNCLKSTAEQDVEKMADEQVTQHGRVIEEIEDDEPAEEKSKGREKAEGTEVVKSQRKKGRARKEAKKEAKKEAEKSQSQSS